MKDNDKPKVVIDGENLVANYSKELKKKITDTLKHMIGLIKNKDYSGIINYAKDEITHLPQEAVGDGYKDLAEIYSILATSYYETGDRSEKTLKLALKAASFNRQSKPAMWLIRELNNKYSPDSMYYRLKVDGQIVVDIKGEVITNKFRTIYSVLADSPEEAMVFVKAFERFEIKDTLKLAKASEIGKKPDLPKGVYETMKLISWDQELFDAAKADDKPNLN